MTLNEKCISVSKAVTDISLRSKSMKTAVIATIWTVRNAHFLEGPAFPSCQQHPMLLEGS